MTPRHIRAFQIGRQRFHVTDRGDGTLQVSGIHPYDETEYHWALKSAGRNFWSIIRNGHKVSTIGTFIATKPDETAEPLSPEQIAYFLIDADQKANLEPRICHN